MDYDSIALTDLAKEPEPKIIANDWVQLLELLNKVCDLANLIEVRFSRGYAKTVALSCFQRGYLAFVLPS